MSDRTPPPPDELHDSDSRVASLVALQQATAPQRGESRNTLIAIALAVYDHEILPVASAAPATHIAPATHTLRIQPERAAISALPVPAVVSDSRHVEPGATVLSLDAARARRIRRMRVVTAVAAVAALAVATPLVLRRNDPTRDPGVAAGATTTVSTEAFPTPVTVDLTTPTPTATFDTRPSSIPTLDDHGIMALNLIPGALKAEMAKGPSKSLPVLPACTAEAIAALGGPPTHAFLARAGSRQMIVVGRAGKVATIAALDITDCHNLMLENNKIATK